jgi:iron complex outermembrane receptor protein
MCVAALVAGGVLLSLSGASAQQSTTQSTSDTTNQPDTVTLPPVVVDTNAAPRKVPAKKKSATAKSKGSTSATAPAQQRTTADGAGGKETAWGPVKGYVATQSAGGTKTDTPLIEIPQSISVVTKDQIDAQKAQSLTEVLRYVPGVSAEPFGFESRFTWIDIRGFDATREGLYMDGLQVRNPNYITSYSFEPYGAERIEIAKGPASVLYGAGAPGGLIDYVSKRPVYENFSEIELDGGNNDYTQGKFDFGGHADPAGTLLFRMTGVVRDADTQQNFVQDDRIFLAPAVTWRPDSQTTWTVLAHYQDDNTNVSQADPAEGTLWSNPFGKISPRFFAGEPGVDFYKHKEDAVTSLFEHVYDGTWTFRQNARYLHSSLDASSVYSTGLKADMRTLDRAYYGVANDLRTFNVDNQAIAKFGTGPIAHELLLGLDYQRLDGRFLGTYGSAASLDIYDPVYGGAVTVLGKYADYDISQWQTGLYAQDQIKFTRNWIMSVAGRYDWAETSTDDHLSGTVMARKDEAFTGRAGLVYKSDFGLAPYVSYSESFLPVTETASGHVLSPETGEQYEVGVKYQPPGMKSFVTAALFDLTRKNYVNYDSATFSYVQTGEANSRGVELGATASLADGLDLVGSFTTFDIEITEGAAIEIGKDPLQTPETLASLWADYTFQGGALKGFGLGGGVRYIGSSYADAGNTIKVPDATVFDAATHYEFDHMTFALNVKNLLDKEYAAGCFVRTTTLCTYGATRSILGSVKVRW